MNEKKDSRLENGWSIYHDLVIDASLQDVFAAVSQPEHLVNWWPLTCKGTPRTGEEYNFFFGPEYDWYGRVVTCKPGTSFHIKMTRSDPDWDPTSFGFDMEQKDGLVHLQFWHRGWPACNTHYRTSSFCWALLLNGLKGYVEKGTVIPFEERS